MFLWARADRLRPMRMVWPKRNHNDPEYSLIRWRKPGLRKVPRMEWISGPKLDDRETRRRFPGRTGEWPLRRRKRAQLSR
jgi:hypothetical protein